MATTVTLKPNAIDISGSTSGTTTVQATAVAGTTTLTLPAATDTLVGKATTDTLTNKTLTGAVMNGTVGATTPSTGAFTTLSATGVTTVQAGTAALPAITTSGDTNTGIFFPAADTIAFSEGGGEAMRINSSGQLGIGTTSPQSLLHLSSTANTRLILADSNSATNQKNAFLNCDGGDFNIGFLSDDFVTATNILRIESGGKLVIGSAANVAKLNTQGTGITDSTSSLNCANSAGTSALLVQDDLVVVIPKLSATGITFPATQSASANANTLDDYEEGTWTPTDGSGASLSLTVTFATYTKVGRLVTCNAKIVFPVTASVASVQINGLPFASSSSNQAVSTISTDNGTYFSFVVVDSVSYLITRNLSLTTLTNVNLSGKTMIFTVSYIV